MALMGVPSLAHCLVVVASIWCVSAPFLLAQPLGDSTLAPTTRKEVLTFFVNTDDAQIVKNTEKVVNSAGQVCGQSKYIDAGDFPLPSPFSSRSLTSRRRRRSSARSPSPSPMSVASPRIVGGEQARPNEFPWQVLLIIEKPDRSQVCGGSILSDKWILTAAQCVCDGDGNVNAMSIQVGVGGHRYLSVLQTLDVRLTRILIYPDYNPYNIENDICLLQVNGSIVLNDNVAPICLPPDRNNVYANRKCVASGWGPQASTNTSAADYLHYTTLNITTNVLCSARLEGIIPSKLCATDNTEDTRRSSCGSDLGGPLAVRESDGTFYLVGIASYDSCGEGLPSVYTRVTSFLNWIYGYIGYPTTSTTASPPTLTPPTYLACDNFELVFIVDASSKSSSTGWQSMLSFVNSVIDRFTISQSSVRVAFVRYATDADVQFYLTTYNDKNSIKQAVSSLLPLGGEVSNLDEAVNLAQNSVFTAKRPGAWKAAIVVTDRLPYSQDVYGSINRAKSSGVYVIPVGINQPGKIDNCFFFLISSDNMFYLATDYDRLSGAVSRIANYACMAGITTLAPPTTSTTTPTTTTTMTTTATTTTIPIGTYCSVTNIELVFVVDSSSKSDSSAWSSMLTFVNSVINKFNVAQNAVRVAFVRYSNQPTVVFNLNSYSDRNSILSAVSGVQLAGGDSNLTAALDLARIQVLSSSNVRSNALKILITVTDQLSATSVNGLATAINNCRSAGIRMYGVGIAYIPGRDIDGNTLYQLSYNSDQTVNPWQATWVYGYSDLPNKVSQLAQFTCVGGTVSL